MQVQGTRCIAWLKGINELNNRLGFWEMRQGGRVVYQCNDYRMEVNPAVDTISDHPKRKVETLGSELRPETGVFVLGSPE